MYLYWTNGIIVKIYVWTTLSSAKCGYQGSDLLTSVNVKYLEFMFDTFPISSKRGTNFIVRKNCLTNTEQDFKLFCNPCKDNEYYEPNPDRFNTDFKLSLPDEDLYYVCIE